MKKINCYFQKLVTAVTDANYRFRVLASKGFFNHWPDEKYLKRMFKSIFGYELNLNNPQTFNEKLQWLKLYDRNPLYTTLVDKYRVKKWVADKIGPKYIIPTIGVWNNPDEINFEKLPNQFVLKCNHNSGLGMCICKDKSKLDIKQVKKELAKGLKQDYYLTGREWPYKDVPRKIIAEKYMVDEKTQELRDYKFFCFNGEPKILFIASDRQNPTEETKFDFFDMNFNHLSFTNGHPNSKQKIEKPEKFEQMKKISEILSQHISHVRVDFYEINGQVYFGEMTFSHWSGFVSFNPAEWDKKIGDWLKLPNE